jgi:hypothetical protein
MESGEPSNGVDSCGHAFQSGNSSLDSVLTDTVLNELKEQSPEGCLLCSFDAGDEKEWD